MEIDEKWLQLLAGEMDADASATLIRDAALELDGFLQSDSQVRDGVIYILDEWLKESLDDLAWGRLKDRLGSYVGMGPANLLSWLSWLPFEDRIIELASIGAYGSQEALGFVRFLIAVYGQRLRKAMIAQKDLADDWQSISINVFHDQIGQFFRLKLVLEKTNDQTVVLEGSPDSMMSLTQQLIRMLKAVDTSEFATERTLEFVADLDELISSLSEHEVVSTGSSG